ncbi:hypothetical protein [Thermococcus thioreducens]|uniref:Uncharacterized protein n=1 Tax=Thermococcus thioreducens TaxID=277988 RepID=A0A1I0N308_9EURY|nr:hypothetical protein [Thermococcus thioreducens]ASJ12186.1 hypothetical protein A3L14_04485 [Thermococcus thioreducens]SEV95269.1 hypothetical protein SAMN05216170_1071 [Thermococcus thioreducens]
MAPIAEMGWGEFEYEVPKGWFGKEKKKLKYVEYKPVFPKSTGSEILAKAIKESLDLDLDGRISIDAALTHTRVRDGRSPDPRGEEPKTARAV